METTSILSHWCSRRAQYNVDTLYIDCTCTVKGLQCRPELSELRRRVLYAAKTRMCVFLDSSELCAFLPLLFIVVSSLCVVL